MVRKSPRSSKPSAPRQGQGLASSAFDRPPGGWLRHLERLFSALGAELPSEATTSALGAYLDEVIRWGRRVDLVAPRSLDELLELSFADAIVLAAHERMRSTSKRFVDVGSGGGAPGIPLCLLLADGADPEFTFVEPRDKRVAFLNHLVGLLGLRRARVIRGRSDALDPGYDVALSRATLPPRLWLAEGARLSEAVWLLLAREAVPEQTGLRRDAEVEYRWPLRNIPHRAVRFIRDP